MKFHITKAVAVFMAVLMLLGSVPAMALPQITLPASASAQETVSNSIFDNVVLGKGTVTNTQTYAAGATKDSAGNSIVDNTLSPYEPYATDDESHPFLPGGDAWIDLSQIYYGAPATQNYPLTKWSANTSVVNITGTGETYGEKYPSSVTASVPAYDDEIYSLADLNLIDEYLWANSSHTIGTKTENGIADSADTLYGQSIVNTKNDTVAKVYNRYDPMQGKWGLTLDRNVSSVCWSPSFVGGYYGSVAPADQSGPSLNNSYLYLSDTPYLYFSTEAIDSTQMAISLLIGTPIQSEKQTAQGEANGNYETQVTSGGKWEYRWYTITDNLPRPGVGTDTLDNSMVPHVYISSPVLTDFSSEQNSEIIPAIAAAGKISPVENAVSEGAVADTLYTSGSITGCIDFTQLLPLVMAETDDKGVANGREGVRYKIAQIRVDTKTVGDVKEKDSACRINYLYFGPAMSTIYTPQSTVGNEVNAANWMYAQHDNNIGDENPNYVGQNAPTDFWNLWYIGTWKGLNYDCSYTNGWENGQTVSITNTPNNPQLMSIDTYGKGDGQLISYNQYKAENNGNEFVRSSQKIDRNNKYLDETTTEASSCVWKYTDDNGKVQYVEADYNSIDGIHYIMVTVPYRKWINVLGNSRKLSMNINVHNYGKFGNVDPAFGLWGNTVGSVGSGHGGLRLTTRYKNENILGIFGTGYYQVDNDDDFACAKVDMTLGESTIYNGATGTTESWFDLLRSPYMYNQTIKESNASCVYGDEMTGYTYVSAVRFAVPVGTEFTVQNMKGDGNSAGLNMYSTSGSIVSAYDGGTGAQPEIDMTTNTLDEKQASVSGTSPNFTYNMESIGTIKGTQNNRAAAYGPHLAASYYTIYDLLDTELMNASGLDAHASTNKNKNIQPFYGRGYVLKNWNSDFIYSPNIYDVPSTDGEVIGTTHAVGYSITAYATVKFTSGDHIWAMVGVLRDNGTPTMGWVQICRSGAWFIEGSNLSGSLVNSGRLVKSYEYTNYAEWYSAGMNATSRQLVWDTLTNNWYASNFTTEYSESGKFTNGLVKNLPNGVDIYYNGNPTLQYANQAIHSGWTYNTPHSRESFKLKAINGGTDLSLDYTRSSTLSANGSFGMTRTLDTPILINSAKDDANAYEKESLDWSYPVLYFDYTNSTSTQLALTVTVDGTPSLYYLDGASGTLTGTKCNLTQGTEYGYYSLEKLIKQLDPGTAGAGKDIYITGVSIFMYFGSSASANNVIRRLEILQPEELWLDGIISANQYSTGGQTASDDMTAKVFDSTNIINDSFYHKHDETSDGKYTITGSSSAGWTYDNQTNSNSYKKTNSNKGWTATIRMDTNGDGNLGGGDTKYDSYAASTVDGVYEYRSSLGHLRLWVPSKTQASVAFTADRSYNIENFRYLYYSYSMRDVESGISAEDRDLKNGITIAIKSQQNSSDQAYLEKDGTWAYYPEGVTYWSDKGHDNREFNTSMNACLDLSSCKFDGTVKSINQFVFYLSNQTNEQAEYYINYVYLSNEPPTELIANKLEETQLQYYYLMDNTGDRYSARFPTIDNPTGQVTGNDNNSDRVNPIKVVRGEYLSTGTYFNGDNIYGYGTYNKNYGSADGLEGSMKNILFYAGTSNDLDDINDYYEYRDTDKDGKAEIYDMMWSYGRWYTGEGESGLNTMYIGDPNTPTNQQGANFLPDSVSGALVRRYATENYVLLRAGITPKKYETYFDADGGEFIYTGSSEGVKNLDKVSENSYFLTANSIMSYYVDPQSLYGMEDLVKPGYTFSHWEHYNSDGTPDNGNGNPANGFNQGADEEYPARLMKFNKKAEVGADYFVAVWDKVNSTPTTATFYKDNALTAKLNERTTSAEEDNGDYILTFPKTSSFKDGNKVTPIYGWYKYDAATQSADTSKIYSPGDKVYLLENTDFVAVTDSAAASNTYTVTLTGAKLYVYTVNGYIHPAEQHGATLIHEEGSDVYKYTGVTENNHMIAMPVTATADYVWTEANRTDGKKEYVIGTSVSVLGSDSAKYEFTAHEDISIVYTSKPSTTYYSQQNNVYATTSSAVMPDSREMLFYSQFELPEGATFVKAGTLFTKNTYYSTLAKDILSTVMVLDETTINATTLKNGSYKPHKDYTGTFRLVQTTSVSEYNEYLLRVTQTKDDAITYYARAYVIYQLGGKQMVAYGDVVAVAGVDAV